MPKHQARPSADLEAIANLPTDALRRKWAELFGSEPAPRISRDVLVRGVAYRIQEEINGRLSQARRRQLKRLAEELRAGRSIASLENRTFKMGTKLIREWKGRVHEVLITEAGYVWGGKHYRSLTQIARLITGTGWSGPRFFGLEIEGRSAPAENAGRASRRRSGSPPRVEADQTMAKSAAPMRCAIYTRKSSEEGLEQSFNSLHAQREACESFVLSQRHEGWSVISTVYDDGGFSGGTMERPALKALLADIDAGKIDVVVVYKIDRLTRSLFDFAKIVETFDANKVSFVSVTQAFNTTTSMGRLTLNVLLSFAQFEREVTSERIRDKFAASKKRGMWMGGNVPLGYEIKNRKLVIDKSEAETVRTIFRLYAELGSVRRVKAEVDRLNLRTKIHSQNPGVTRGGLRFRIGHLYTILRNRLYRGEIQYKSEIYAGDHEAIVELELWDTVQARLAANAAIRRSGKSFKEPSLLAGILFDGANHRMTPTHAVKNGKRYRYYISNKLIAGAEKGRKISSGEGVRIPAHEIEGHVVAAIAAFLGDAPKVVAELCRELVPGQASDVIRRAEILGNELRTTHRAELHERIRSLITRIQVNADSINVELRRSALIGQLEISLEEVGSDPDAILALTLPCELRRLGKEKRLIVAAHEPKTYPDTSLIKALVKAHEWFGLLRSRSVDSITHLANKEGVQRTYLSRIVPLAFLAPDIVETILDGQQPIELSLDRLLASMPLPLDWRDQRAVLGFPAH